MGPLAHAERYNRLARQLYNQEGLPKNIDRSNYDKAKNWMGGFDYGQREGDDWLSRLLASGYQFTDILKGGDPYDAKMDYQENLRGLEEGALAAEFGFHPDDELLNAVARWFPYAR